MAFARTPIHIVKREIYIPLFLYSIAVLKKSFFNIITYFLRKVKLPPALAFNIWLGHMARCTRLEGVTSSAKRARQIRLRINSLGFGKNNCHMRSLEVAEILHMGVLRGKNGLGSAAIDRSNSYRKNFHHSFLLLQIYKVILASILR